MSLTVRPLVIGTPRSGFSLLIAMIQRIVDHRKLSFMRTPQQEVITRLMPLFSYVLNKSYEIAFDAHGLRDKLLFNGEFQLLVGGPKWLSPGEPWMGVRKYLGCRGHGDFLLVTKHPRLLFEYHGVLHSHDAPKRWLQESAYNECLKFATVRHPLDIFNSAVHSINALASEYLQRYCPGADEDRVRQQIALNKLTDMRICKGLMAHQIKYWQEYLACRNGYRELRWEGVVSDPVSSVQWVGKQLGLDIDASEAEAIWKPMDHRNLLVHHLHNYRKDHGIVGDWLRHLHPRHVELADSMGLLEVMQTLGYELEAWPVDVGDSEFRLILDEYLARGEVFPMDDSVLAGLCFNKSNIDASAFNFKSFPGRKWAYIERSTVDNDSLVLDVLECAEQGSERINEIANTIGACSTDNIDTLVSVVLPACETLATDDTSRALLDQALLSTDRRRMLLWQALTQLPKGSLIWGVGQDLLAVRSQDEVAFDELLRSRSLCMVDAALAGRNFAGFQVQSFDNWEFNGACVLLTPFSVPTRQQMRKIAVAKVPAIKVIDPYLRRTEYGGTQKSANF